MAESHGTVDPYSEDAAVLRRLSIFGALKPDTITFLRSQCDQVAVPKGEHYFRQGETGDSVFILRSGRVAVVRDLEEEHAVLAELTAGQCFGEVALVAISPRTATVTALDDSTALRLRCDALMKLASIDLEQFTILQMNLGREVARRLAHADEALFEYARRCGETNPGAAYFSRSAETLK